MSENLKFYKGIEADLENIEVIQLGAIYHCIDTGNTYLGVQDGNSIQLELFSSKVGKLILNANSDEGEIFNDYKNNKALGRFSHAEGHTTTASGFASHAEGCGTISDGQAAHAEGEGTIAKGINAHAEGKATAAENYAHAEGFETSAEGQSSHSEGEKTRAIGDYSHAEGLETSAGQDIYVRRIKNYSLLYDNTLECELEIGVPNDWGKCTITLHRLDNYDYITTAHQTKDNIEIRNDTDVLLTMSVEDPTSLLNADEMLIQFNPIHRIGCHAEGYKTSSDGAFSHSEGMETLAQGYASHVEGYGCRAIGNFAHAEGTFTCTNGTAAHAEGHETYAEDAAHAEGLGTQAIGYAAHAEGQYTVANGAYSHVQGTYNILDDTVTPTEPKGTYAYMIGNGTDEDNRSNAMTVDWNGNGWFAGKMQATTAVIASGIGYGTIDQMNSIDNPAVGQIFYVLT